MLGLLSRTAGRGAGPAALVGSKPLSRRDSHRFDQKLKAIYRKTRPDFTAQRAQEAKAARGRKARRRAAGN